MNERQNTSLKSAHGPERSAEEAVPVQKSLRISDNRDRAASSGLTSLGLAAVGAVIAGRAASQSEDYPELVPETPITLGEQVRAGTILEDALLQADVLSDISFETFEASPLDGPDGDMPERQAADPLLFAPPLRGASEEAPHFDVPQSAETVTLASRLSLSQPVALMAGVEEPPHPISGPSASTLATPSSGKEDLVTKETQRLVPGVVDLLLGEKGLVTGVVGEVLGPEGLVTGLTGALIGPDGIVIDVLNAALGADSLLASLLEGVLGQGGLLGGLLGAKGPLGEVTQAALGEGAVLTTLAGTVVGTLDSLVGSQSALAHNVLQPLLSQTGVLGGIATPLISEDGTLGVVVESVTQVVVAPLAQMLTPVSDTLFAQGTALGSIVQTVIGDDSLIGDSLLAVNNSLLSPLLSDVLGPILGAGTILGGLLGPILGAGGLLPTLLAPVSQNLGAVGAVLETVFEAIGGTAGVLEEDVDLLLAGFADPLTATSETTFLDFLLSDAPQGAEMFLSEGEDFLGDFLGVAAMPARAMAPSGSYEAALHEGSDEFLNGLRDSLDSTFEGVSDLFEALFEAEAPEGLSGGLFASELEAADQAFARLFGEEEGPNGASVDLSETVFAPLEDTEKV